MDHGKLRLYTVVPKQLLKIMQKSIGIEPIGKIKLNSKKIEIFQKLIIRKRKAKRRGNIENNKNVDNTKFKVNIIININELNIPTANHTSDRLYEEYKRAHTTQKYNQLTKKQTKVAKLLNQKPLDTINYIMINKHTKICKYLQSSGKCKHKKTREINTQKYAFRIKFKTFTILSMGKNVKQLEFSCIVG